MAGILLRLILMGVLLFQWEVRGKSPYRYSPLTPTSFPFSFSSSSPKDALNLLPSYHLLSPQAPHSSLQIDLQLLLSYCNY